MYYILDENKNVIKEPDVKKWGKWIDNTSISIKKNIFYLINNPSITSFSPEMVKNGTIEGIEEIKISTIFLGIDNTHIPGGEAVLFETMVFGGPLDEFRRRYTTYNEAIIGHNSITERVKEKLEELTQNKQKSIPELENTKRKLII